MMDEYEEIFDAIHGSLIEYGSRNLSVDAIETALHGFKEFENRSFSDDDYFRKLVSVAFYSGFKAETVTSKRDVINRHFPGLDEVANYNESKEDEILSDPAMIKNQKKVRGCIRNAKQLLALAEKYGSVEEYIESFEPRGSFENLMLLKEDLQGKLSYLGNITVYHFLTDIGMPVIKPDRVVCRIFKRLGLIDNESQLLKAVIQGRKMAEAKKLPVRYVDIVLVTYGQASAREFGMDRGICLSEPRCDFCRAKKYCLVSG